MIFGTTPTPKTLIVVYKDEMLLNQLKKMVESNDDVDPEKVVGTTNSINIVAWSEKMWLVNKKAGNINSKVLFLGEISGADKLIPVIDVKYNEYGVIVGWAGNQAILYAEPKELENNEKYYAFVHELEKEPVPEMIKHPKSIRVKDAENADDNEEKSEEAADVRGESVEVENEAKKHVPRLKIKTPEFMLKAKGGFEKSFNKVAEKASDVGEIIADKAEEVLRDKKAVKRQMLFYGAVKFYQNCLDDFMNL